MNAAPSVEARLQDLEEQLLQREVRASAERISELLADDFVEFGSSGQVFDKKQIVAALRKESPAKRSLSQFKATMLSDSVALVTYRASRIPEPGAVPVHTLRSSIWCLGNGQWRMVFHQGTLSK